MGKSWKTGCCPPIGSCWGAGPASAQEAPSEQQQLTLVQRLQAEPNDVTKFKEILTFIDEALERHRKPKPGKWNAHVPEVINGNVEAAEVTFSQIYNLCKEMGGKKDVQIELQEILSDAFGGLGSLHWITAAFSMVAFVLKRVENTRTNKETSWDILEKVKDLGHKLVDLFEVAPDKSKEFWQIGSSIVEVAIFCMKELDASYFRRFTFVNVRMGDVSKFKEEISHLYQKLTLIIVEENARRTAPSMSSFKPESQSIVGRDKMINDILELMQQEPQTCQAILLHGLGGIGKTTIANKIVAESGGKFNSIAHAEIGLKPTSQSICNCQKEILERLSGFKREIRADSEGRKLLHDHFNKSTTMTPILLFVDNVSRRDDLETLLPEKMFSILPENSYVLVTSRDARVSNAFTSSGAMWKEYHVDGLSESDAKELLMKRLGGCSKDGGKQLDAVLGICKGWPLAIDVVGSHLGRYKEDVNMWKSSIKQLQEFKSVSNDSEDKLTRILEWSYNMLDEASKNVFLDISCLLRNAPWSWVEALGTGSEVKALEARSLIRHVGKWEYTGLFGKLREPLVEVHDLLVALGQQKSSQVSPARRRYSTYELPAATLGDDDHEGEWEHVQGLVVESWDKFAAKRLDNMCKNLRILLFLGEIDGECQQIPKNLQICSTRGFPYRSLNGLRDLRVLLISRDTGSMKLGEEILPDTLQILSLYGIKTLHSFHENAFRDCSGLHTVSIKYCDYLKELPANICDISAMRVLSLVGNSTLRTLPPGLNGMEVLEHFHCIRCPLEEFPSAIALLRNLRTLSLKGFEALPVSVDLSQLSQLTHLHLNFIFLRTTTEQRVHGFEELCALEILRIEYWRSPTQLLEDVSKLTALQELSLSGCSLQQLPEGLQSLHALSVFDLSHCHNLEELPDSVVQLSSLEKLDLSSCKALVQLPDNFHKLLALSELKLKYCTALQSLPDTFLQLSSLETLELDGCTSLREIPRGLGTKLPRLSPGSRREVEVLEHWIVAQT